MAFAISILGYSSFGFSDHTGQNIAEAFQDVLANWNISMSRVTASTTDNRDVTNITIYCNIYYCNTIQYGLKVNINILHIAIYCDVL